MANTIANGANTPLNVRTGTVPDVSGALKDWFQPMVFEIVSKSVQAFQVVEVGTQINFWGVIQPGSGRDLLLKPEGQRAWTPFHLYAEPSLTLQVDDVVLYLGVQTRIMSRQDFTIYGYVFYILAQDWTGSGPA